MVSRDTVSRMLQVTLRAQIYASNNRLHSPESGERNLDCLRLLLRSPTD